MNLYPHPRPYCHCQELKMWLAPSTEHIIIVQKCTAHSSVIWQKSIASLSNSNLLIYNKDSIISRLTYMNKTQKKLSSYCSIFSALVLVWLLLKTILWRIFYLRYGIQKVIKCNIHNTHFKILLTADYNVLFTWYHMKIFNK